MSKNFPRFIELPSDFFDMSEDGKKKWARSFLRNIARPDKNYTETPAQEGEES